MIEYASICMKKSSAGYARILMQYMTNYWVVIKTEAYSEHCQTFKMERFAKIVMTECKCATRNFSGWGDGGWGCITRALL